MKSLLCLVFLPLIVSCTLPPAYGIARRGRSFYGPTIVPRRSTYGYIDSDYSDRFGRRDYDYDAGFMDYDSEYGTRFGPGYRSRRFGFAGFNRGDGNDYFPRFGSGYRSSRFGFASFDRDYDYDYLPRFRSRFSFRRFGLPRFRGDSDYGYLPRFRSRVPPRFNSWYDRDYPEMPDLPDYADRPYY